MHKLEQSNVSKLTTMRIGGNAEYIFFPESAEELISILFELKSKKMPWSIIGAGSNTLASSQGIEGALICTTGMDWIEKKSNETFITGPGMRLPKLAGICAQMGLGGAEFYEGIPGSVGGAVVMNAGAHGHWSSEILEKVTFFDTETFEVIELVSGQIEFGYRKSNIDTGRYIILEAKYRLSANKTTATIQDTMKEYSQKRSKSQPKGASSGCIFRNPGSEIFAGRIIDEMGLKGTQIGGAEVSNIHANFIVNSKEATSEHVCKLMHFIQSEAWKRHNVWLQPEVQPLGKFNQTDNIIWMHPEARPENWLELVS